MPAYYQRRRTQVELLERAEEVLVEGSEGMMDCEVYLQEHPTEELLALESITDYTLETHQSRWLGYGGLGEGCCAAM